MKVSGWLNEWIILRLDIFITTHFYWLLFFTPIYIIPIALMIHIADTKTLKCSEIDPETSYREKIVVFDNPSCQVSIFSLEIQTKENNYHDHNNIGTYTILWCIKFTTATPHQFCLSCIILSRLFSHYPCVFCHSCVANIFLIQHENISSTQHKNFIIILNQFDAIKV